MLPISQYFLFFSQMPHGKKQTNKKEQVTWPHTFTEFEFKCERSDQQKRMKQVGQQHTLVGKITYSNLFFILLLPRIEPLRLGTATSVAFGLCYEENNYKREKKAYIQLLIKLRERNPQTWTLFRPGANIHPKQLNQEWTVMNAGVSAPRQDVFS